MPPINLLNYHLLGDSKPHSRETANRLTLKAVTQTSAIKRILKGRK